MSNFLHSFAPGAPTRPCRTLSAHESWREPHPITTPSFEILLARAEPRVPVIGEARLHDAAERVDVGQCVFESRPSLLFGRGERVLLPLSLVVLCIPRCKNEVVLRVVAVVGVIR